MPGVDYCYDAVRVDVLTYHEDADDVVVVGGGASTTAVPPETGPTVNIAPVVRDEDDKDDNDRPLRRLRRVGASGGRYCRITTSSSWRSAPPT